VEEREKKRRELRGRVDEKINHRERVKMREKQKMTGYV
jgi:hypothetical protein